MHKLVFLFCLITLVACDPEGKKQCAWTLEPEPKLKDKTQEGYIPVCARNRVTAKQDCRLQSSLGFAKKAFQRKFRYVDMKVKSPALPRTLVVINFCDRKTPMRIEDK